MSNSQQEGNINPAFRRKAPSSAPVVASTLVSQLRQGDRNALAKAITFVESQLPEHRTLAQEIIHECTPYSGQSERIAITGSPGVGKSTFIEAMGKEWLARKGRIAILAVDPSSHKTGGSILGDKTRMEVLSTHPHVFVRPSPAGSTLGGIARCTRETILLCEAAGYDTILVETVGVGQSEHAVSQITDLFILLVLPGAGDELQGIKRGIVEMADIVVVHKADGSQLTSAQQTRRAYANALHLYAANDYGWSTLVLTASSQTGNGISVIWEKAQSYFAYMRAEDRLAHKRKSQAEHWFYQRILDLLKHSFYENAAVQARLPELLQAISEGSLSPFIAAERLVRTFNP